MYARDTSGADGSVRSARASSTASGGSTPRSRRSFSAIRVTRSEGAPPEPATSKEASSRGGAPVVTTFTLTSAPSLLSRAHDASRTASTPNAPRSAFPRASAGPGALASGPSSRGPTVRIFPPAASWEVSPSESAPRSQAGHGARASPTARGTAIVPRAPEDHPVAGR